MIGNRLAGYPIVQSSAKGTGAQTFSPSPSREGLPFIPHMQPDTQVHEGK